MRTALLAVSLVLALAACGGSADHPVCLVACIQTPAVTLTVRDARGSNLTATVSLSNLVVPPGVSTSSSSCTTSSGSATCTIVAAAAGHYEFDVNAPGFVTQHLVVEVGVPIVAPTGCCPVPFVPAKRDVSLVAQ